MSSDPYDPTNRRPVGRPSPWTYLGPLLTLFGLVVILAWLFGYWGHRDAVNDPAPRANGRRPRRRPPTRSPPSNCSRPPPPASFTSPPWPVQRDRVTLNLHEIPQGTGSGFIWDTQGHIVTNFHVIRDAEVARTSSRRHRPAGPPHRRRPGQRPGRPQDRRQRAGCRPSSCAPRRISRSGKRCSPSATRSGWTRR